MGDFLCVSVCVKQKLCAGNYYFFPFFLPRVHPGSRTGVEGCPHSRGDGSRRCRRAEALAASSRRSPSPEPAPRPPLGAGSTAPLRGCLAGGQRTLLGVTFLNKRSRVTRPLPSPRVGHLTPLSTLPGASPCRRGGRTTSPRWPSHVGTRRGSETARVTQFPPLLSSRPFCP